MTSWHPVAKVGALKPGETAVVRVTVMTQCLLLTHTGAIWCSFMSTFMAKLGEVWVPRAFIREFVIVW